MIEYIVNEEKRTIVAMIKLGDKDNYHLSAFNKSESIFEDLWIALKRIKNSSNYYDKEYYSKMNKMSFPYYMSAKAKCNPSDEWNEEYGKEIARKRLVGKIHKYRSNAYGIIIELINEISNSFIK